MRIEELNCLSWHWTLYGMKERVLQTREKAIREAALAPTIHQELWEEYNGNIPSDATLRIELRKKKFTESAIEEFIRGI